MENNKKIQLNYIIHRIICNCLEFKLHSYRFEWKNFEILEHLAREQSEKSQWNISLWNKKLKK